MSVRVAIPLVSTNAADVTVTAWQAHPGDSVVCGQVLLEVATDKAAFEIESPADGIVLAVFAPPRSVVPIGYIVALLGTPGETDGAVEADNAAIVAAHRAALTASESSPAQTPCAPLRPAVPSATTPAAPAGAVRATPKAQRLAREQGLDLVRIQAETGAAIITEAVLAPYLRS